MIADRGYGRDVTFSESNCLFCASPLATWEWRAHFDACLAIAVSDGNDHELPPPVAAVEPPVVAPPGSGWKRPR